MTSSSFCRTLIAAAVCGVLGLPVARAEISRADVYQTLETEAFVIHLLKENVEIFEGLSTITRFDDSLNTWPDGYGSEQLGADVAGEIMQSIIEAAGFWERSADLGRAPLKGETYAGISYSANALLASNIAWLPEGEMSLWLAFNQGEKSGRNLININALQLYYNLIRAETGRTALTRRNFDESYLECLVHELGHGLGMSTLLGYGTPRPASEFTMHLSDSLGRPAGSTVTGVVGSAPSLYRDNDAVFFIIAPSVPSSSFADLGADVGYLHFHGETVDALTNGKGLEVLGATGSETSSFCHLALKASAFGFESRQIMPTAGRTHVSFIRVPVNRPDSAGHCRNCDSSAWQLGCS